MLFFLSAGIVSIVQSFNAILCFLCARYIRAGWKLGRILDLLVPEQPPVWLLTTTNNPTDQGFYPDHHRCCHHQAAYDFARSSLAPLKACRSQSQVRLTTSPPSPLPLTAFEMKQISTRTTT